MFETLKKLWISIMAQFQFFYRNWMFVLEDIIFRNINKTELINHSGKILLITGGTRGLGVEIIKMLLKCDFSIIIGCRKVENAEALLQDARNNEICTGHLTAYPLDTSSLESVRKFAEMVKNNHKKINILLNNAGIMNVPYSESVDGIESIFATNYLGHFLLTHLLLPEIAASAEDNCNPRIINVTSCAHFNGEINFNDINNKCNFTFPKAYSQSKLAQVLFTKYLDRALKGLGENINVYAVHPGVCATEIFEGTAAPKLLLKYVFKTAKQGATPVVHTCLSPFLNERGGSYITNCRIKPPSLESQSKELQEKLFNLSMDLAKIKDYFELIKDK